MTKTFSIYFNISCFYFSQQWLIQNKSTYPDAHRQHQQEVDHQHNYVHSDQSVFGLRSRWRRRRHTGP